MCEVFHPPERACQASSILLAGQQHAATLQQAPHSRSGRLQAAGEAPLSVYVELLSCSTHKVPQTLDSS